MQRRLWLGLVVVAALAGTLLVSVTSLVSFAYRGPALHVALETAATLISLLAAQLTYGRFRRSLDRGDLLLTAALVLFAGVNLLFSAVPAVAGADDGRFATWTSASAGILAAGLFAAGAFARPRRTARPGRASREAALLCVLALAGIALVVALAGDWLPRAIDPGLSPEAATRPRIVGNPVLLAVQLVVMALFAAAAIGFARKAERVRDPLMQWFAIAAVLGAFARLNYFLFPSRFSEFFYTGDVLRLGFFLAVLLGGAYEIRRAQRGLEQAAVLEERRRLAREIHDGMAQDLAFIVQQTAALERRDGDSSAVAEIGTAARRALDESRAAIAALVRPMDEPLADALARVAQDAAGRWGTTVEPSVAAGLELSSATRMALLRIVGEAVTNAARHGHAQHVRVALTDDPRLLLRISDDGTGFDPAQLNGESGRHGIMGMRERAAQIGGQLRVDSRPGEGTEIVVTLP